MLNIDDVDKQTSSFYRMIYWLYSYNFNTAANRNKYINKLKIEYTNITAITC